MLRLLLDEASAQIKRRPQRSGPWNDMLEAWSEAQFQRQAEAKAALARASASNLNDTRVLAARGHVLAELGEFMQAQAEMDAALTIDPENDLARLDRGRLRLSRSQPAPAAEDLVKVLSSMPDGRNLFSGRTPIDRLLASSDQAFERAVTLRSEDQQLWVARGRHLAWHARWQEAAVAYERGVRARPLFHDWLEYGSVLVLSGDFERYHQLCMRLGDGGLGTDLPTAVEGQIEDRLAEALRIACLYPDSGVDSKRILDWAARALLPDRNGAWILYAAARARYRTGDVTAAVSLLDRAARAAVDINWNGLELIRYLLATCHHRLGHSDDARRWYDLAEAGMASKSKRATQEPTLPLDYYIVDDLEARVLEREARAVLESTKNAAESMAKVPAS
jgi:tetratricopeptide (TPR) repeat protein